MERGLTLTDIAHITRIEKETLRVKLARHGIKPVSFEAVYNIKELDPLWSEVVIPPRPPGRPKGIPQKKKVISQTPSTS
jgi:hypothetical protein